jgi:two-component system, chemotaxis family, protein-glutamate methylesterase/glutaminase
MPQAPSEKIMATELSDSGKLRVLIVDDSAVVRAVIQRIVEREPGFHVVGTARDGQMAIERCRELRPDVVTLDVEMPVLDGLGALPGLLECNRDLAVLMISSLTVRGARETIDALMKGAFDYITKPSQAESRDEALAQFSSVLVPKLRTLAERKRFSVPIVRPVRASLEPAPLRPSLSPRNVESPRILLPPRSSLSPSVESIRVGERLVISRESAHVRSEPRVLAIGSSTGGPAALAAILGALPSDFTLPIVIAQHMPETFTRLLAERLSEVSRFNVREALAGEQLRPGEAWVAPGNHHLTVVRAGGEKLALSLNSDPPVNCCRPSIDVLLASLAEAAGRHTLAVILTGMGHDGRDGASAIRKAGGLVLAQDEASSVVWGMPGSVVSAGLAHGVYPLDQLAGEIGQRARVGRALAKAGS